MNCWTSIPCIVSALGLAVIAGPAGAQDHALRQVYSRDSHKVVIETGVPYSDINPASAEGARVLLARIGVAADQVCGGAAIPRSDYQKREFGDCRRTAISEAVDRMRSPALTTLASQAPARRLAGR